MKYHLFIDNFRGFTNTCIPITDVNFLVGQNSTGKTSVMGLLKLFSGPRFLMQQHQAFGDEHVTFGHFSDMVSVHSEDRSYFHIGLVWESLGEKQGEKQAAGWLCTYVEDQGLPQLFSYKFYRDSRSMSIRFTGDQIYFKTETHQTLLTEEEIISTLLPRWVNERSSHTNGYEKLDAAGLPGRLPILVALAMVGTVGDSPNAKRN